MTSLTDRQTAVKLIEESMKSGSSQASACKVLGLSARTYQRWCRGGEVRVDGRPAAKRPVPSNKLTQEERQAVLDVCHEPEYAGLPPGQIVPRLADAGLYLASESTFYRILHESGEQHHRSRSRKPKKSRPPEGYCASRPNQVWTWDITWLPTLIRGLFFYLYMVLDVYSRKVVVWEVREREIAEYAAVLLEQAILSEKCILDPPVLHADNGSPQKGSTMLMKMHDLGVTPSFSRPGVSNDNPYSESLFRTCKYRPEYPVNGFKDINEAREWVNWFVTWYNNEHLHSALKHVTPVQKHRGEDRKILAHRQLVYESARQKSPQRWSRLCRDWTPVPFSWLNPPADKHEREKSLKNGSDFNHFIDEKKPKKVGLSRARSVHIPLTNQPMEAINLSQYDNPWDGNMRQLS